MGWKITWRRHWRYLVTWTATFAGGISILACVTGWHPRLLDIALPVAGALSSSGFRRIYRAAMRKGRVASTDQHGELDRQAVPLLPPEVVVLVEQGRKITAIARYRELNPGVGLKEAKDVIDELAGRVLSSRGVADPARTPV
jgi:hypothetical protein